MGWTIKQISKASGVPPDTLRYYDREGIISPKRHENGYRYYDEADLLTLKYIVVMKYARFSLAEIRIMVELFRREAGDGCTECKDICNDILGLKITELEHMISNYRKIIGLMEKLMPMIQDAETYQESNIEGFICQIFEDIQKERKG